MGEASTRQADVIIHDSFPPEQIAVILVGSENPLTNLSIDTRDGLLKIIILRQGGLNTLRYQIVLHLLHPKHTKNTFFFGIHSERRRWPLFLIWNSTLVSCIFVNFLIYKIIGQTLYCSKYENQIPQKYLVFIFNCTVRIKHIFSLYKIPVFCLSDKRYVERIVIRRDERKSFIVPRVGIRPLYSKLNDFACIKIPHRHIYRLEIYIPLQFIIFCVHKHVIYHVI